MTAPLSAWSKLPLVLCLLLLVPRVGLAAQDAPVAPDVSTDSEAPVTDEEAPQEQEVQAEPESEPESFARPERWRVPLGVRLLGEAGGGLLTSAGAALAGGFLGFGLCEAAGAGTGAFGGCAWGAAVGVGVGGLVGYPLGVWWGGESLGGDGRLLSSFAGMGVGLAASLLLGVASQQFDPGGRITGPIGGLLLLAGPIVFYELSQRQEPGVQGHASAPRPRLQPLLSVSPNGALLGLGGTF